MVCLTCGSFQADTRSRCEQCDSFLGYPAEGRGYLPQLVQLQEGLQKDELTEEQGEDRLIRMDEALGATLQQMDLLGAQIMNLPLDDVQSATVGGFLHPVRDSLVQLREVAANLSLDGNWSEEDWSRLRAAQARLMQANQGVSYLYQFLGEVAVRQGHAWPPQ